MSITNVVTIAGSDSSGGAGIQADLKAFSALGVYGASVLTALTAQNTRGVTAIFDVDPHFVTAQIDAVFGDIDIAAVKIGMLSRPEVIEAVADGLVRHRAPQIVLDPVMVAKSGHALLQPDAVAALKSRLIPLATVITPNLPEAGVLLGREGIESNTVEAAQALRRLGAQSVLLKGGHGSGPTSEDILVGDHGVDRFGAARIETRNTHGTGCTLASAIAAYLARGNSVPEAVTSAKQYITGAIGHADELAVGSGHGPVHHFYRLWRS